MAAKKKPCLSRKHRKAFIAAMLDRFLPKPLPSFTVSGTARVQDHGN